MFAHGRNALDGACGQSDPLGQVDLPCLVPPFALWATCPFAPSALVSLLQQFFDHSLVKQQIFQLDCEPTFSLQNKSCSWTANEVFVHELGLPSYGAALPCLRILPCDLLDSPGSNSNSASLA